jgi:hypothetical protein
MAAKRYKGKSLRPGGGGRFARLKDAMMSQEGYSENRASAIAAAVGRRKYGKRRFAEMAAAGRRRAA